MDLNYPTNQNIYSEWSWILKRISYEIHSKQTKMNKVLCIYTHIYIHIYTHIYMYKYTNVIKGKNVEERQGPTFQPWKQFPLDPPLHAH